MYFSLRTILLLSGVIQEALADASDGPFIVEWVRRLSDGLDRLNEGGIAAVLLDLFLPDSQGINTFGQALPGRAYVPILVLGGLGDEDIAKEAVERGAQDYLLKNRLDSYSLTRALHSVIARKAAEDALFLEKERAQVTLNSIGDAVISTDISGNITYLNQVAERMTGWSGERHQAGRLPKCSKSSRALHANHSQSHAVSS
jgi:PAS domain-containing protein